MWWNEQSAARPREFIAAGQSSEQWCVVGPMSLLASAVSAGSRSGGCQPLSHPTNFKAAIKSENGIPMNQYVKKTVVLACLLTLTGLAGCHGYQQYETGLPWLDRWMAPYGVEETWPPAEQLVPHEGPALPADPPATPSTPPPPADLLKPELPVKPKLPALPNDSALETDRQPYFGDDIGLTPFPGR